MNEFDIDGAVAHISRAVEYTGGDVSAIALVARDQIRRALEHGHGSRTTETLVGLLRRRDSYGREKYGTSLDRTDLTEMQWGRHMLEELLDAAGYLQRWMDHREGKA